MLLPLPRWLLSLLAFVTIHLDLSKNVTARGRIVDTEDVTFLSQVSRHDVGYLCSRFK